MAATKQAPYVKWAHLMGSFTQPWSSPLTNQPLRWSWSEASLTTLNGGAHAAKACWRQPLASSNLASEYRSLGVWLDLYGSFGPCDGGDCPLALVQIYRLSKSSLGRTATAERAQYVRESEAGIGLQCR